MWYNVFMNIDNQIEPELKHSITEMANGYCRILTMKPPFDKRDPDPSKNYGIHGMELRFVLLKNKRAVQFIVYTPIYLPHVMEEFKQKLSTGEMKSFPEIIGADVGYHSPEPMYEGQESFDDDCVFTGGRCFYDGSGLRAHTWIKIWLKHGMNVIWQMMEHEWQSNFNPDFDGEWQTDWEKEEPSTF